MIQFFKQKRVYLDYASAPPVRAEAEAAMREAAHLVGNPGAIHREAVEAKKSLQHSRERIARMLEVKARDVVFTSGLTESNNLAILGFARQLERTRRSLEGTHWVVSAIEHSSVLACFAEVERLGGTVTHLDPDERGLITSAAVQSVLKAHTVFVSIGWANNEIGTVQPLRDIAATLRAYEKAQGSEIIFHTDAGQAPLYLSTTAHSLGVDLIALGSNKLYGPHGIGALYRSHRVHLAPVLFGGPQESGLRAGTENVALAAGFATACECAARERESEAKRLRAMRDSLARAILAEVPEVIVNGDMQHAMPHMLNISVPDISSEYLALALDARGFALSTKSACREGEESLSHVVAALPVGRQVSGGEAWAAAHTLRISLGRETRPRDLAAFPGTLHRILRNQRK